MTIQVRNLTPNPTTINLEDGTGEAIVSTGADVQRPGYVERLNLQGADLSALVGAPVLDAHKTSSERDQLGVILEAQMRSEGLWVRFKLRDNPRGRSIAKDVSDGTVRGLSVAYIVTEKKDEGSGPNRVRTAMKWKPIEVSIVPVPADPGAHFRNGEHQMSNEQTQENTGNAAQDAAAIQTRARQNALIRQIAQTANLDGSFADAQIDAAATPDEARSAAFEAMQQRSVTSSTRTVRASVGFDNNDPAVIITRAGEAIFARHNPSHALSDPARQYAGQTTLDLARDSLKRAHVSSLGMSPDTVITRALHTTSDFALILGDATGRELRRSYETAPSGIKPVARQANVRDFREKRALQLGQGPELQKVVEGGEFKQGTIDESAETYKAETFGRIFSISR